MRVRIDGRSRIFRSLNFCIRTVSSSIYIRTGERICYWSCGLSSDMGDGISEDRHTAVPHEGRRRQRRLGGPWWLGGSMTQAPPGAWSNPSPDLLQASSGSDVESDDDQAPLYIHVSGQKCSHSQKSDPLL